MFKKFLKGIENKQKRKTLTGIWICFVLSPRELPGSASCHAGWIRNTDATAVYWFLAGLFDVVPAGSLDGLTAEDFRLLLNGVGDINVATLISYTSFNDESGEPGDR